MPKSRNRQSKAVSRQVWKKLRAITNVLREYYVTLNQHAAVVNAQRAQIAGSWGLHIQLLEEVAYANLTPEQRERIMDVLDPQPEQQPVTEAVTAAERKQSTAKSSPTRPRSKRRCGIRCRSQAWRTT